MNQKLGIYETITDDYILAGVKSDLSLEDTNMYDLFLKDQINLGVKELKTLSNFVECVSQLEIVDYKTKLPSNFYRFTKNYPVVFVNAEGKAVNGVSGQTVTTVAINSGGGNMGSTTVSFPIPYLRNSSPAFINNAFFKDSPYNNGGDLCGTVNVVNGWLYFSTDVTAQFVKVGYMGSNVDDNGRLVYPSFTERALRAFAAYRFCRKFFTTHGAIMNDYKTEWMKGKAECKAIAAMPDSEQYQFINRTVKSLY